MPRLSFQFFLQSSSPVTSSCALSTSTTPPPLHQVRVGHSHSSDQATGTDLHGGAQRSAGLRLRGTEEKKNLPDTRANTSGPDALTRTLVCPIAGQHRTEARAARSTGPSIHMIRPTVTITLNISLCRLLLRFSYCI